MTLQQLAAYLPYGLKMETPDGIGKLVGIPNTLITSDRINIHFGEMVDTKHSLDGYDLRRNHGAYTITAKRYEPIGAKGITENGFDMPGGCLPILRPLSQLTETIVHEGREFVPFVELGWSNPYDLIDVLEDSDFQNISFDDALKLLSWHFNIFNLPENEFIIKQATE